MKLAVSRLLSYLFAVSILLTSCSTDHTVSIMHDKSSLAVSFAANEIFSVLSAQEKAVSIVKPGSSNVSDKLIILTTQENNQAHHSIQSEALDLKDQEYVIRIIKSQNQSTYLVIGGSQQGAMYGGLAIADHLKSEEGFASITEVAKKPYIKKRGIKLNIPLDARTPSYSDNNIVSQGNIPYMWDMNFWKSFLDEMARNRLNLLTLWSLSPWPSMVRIPEYPEVGIEGVMRTTLPVTAFGKSGNGSKNVTPGVLANLELVKEISLDEKIAFWQEVMEYGQNRGVDFFIYTWNIFTFGTEDTSYGFSNKLDNETTRDYIRKATKAMIKTYPLLKGMGITAGEKMSKDHHKDELYLFDTYGRGINEALAEDPNRTFHLVHRLGDVTIANEAFKDLNPRCKFSHCHKYSKAHVYSSVDPYWIHDHKFVEQVADGSFFITVRDDTHNYLRGGSDPDFVRQYVQNIPNIDVNFEGFQLGPDATVWARDFVSRAPDAVPQLVLEKRWYSMRQWGLLSYDPSVTDKQFEDMLAFRFPKVDSRHLFDAWRAGSKVIPLVNRFHNHKAYLDYQWNPELCDSKAGYNSENGFHDMETFIRILVQRDEGLIGIPDYVQGETNGITPLQVAQELLTISETTLLHASQVTLGEGTDKELKQTVSDIYALGYLGGYYGHKIAASTHYAFFQTTGEQDDKHKAIEHLQKASDYWWHYSKRIDQHYLPMYYSRLGKHINILNLQQYVDREITDLNGTVPDHSLLSVPTLD